MDWEQTRQSPEWCELQAFVASFVDKAGRRRLSELLERPKRWEEIKEMLCHFQHFDMRHVIPVANCHGGAEQVREVLRLLRSFGAPIESFVISAAPSLDARRLPLEDALALIIGSNSGTIVSCITGKLAYYEGEDINTRFVLRRV